MAGGLESLMARRFFTDSEYAAVDAACARLIPTDDQPGAHEARVVDYIDGLLGAFASDPPLIWAGGPFSGRFGGSASFAAFHHLTPLEELAWRTRIEGSLGRPERERLGPVEGLQEEYRKGLAALGTDFVSVSPDQQDQRLRDNGDFRAVLYAHACQGMYGAPEYGGNQGEIGWKNIGFAGDVQPRGYTDEEVSQRE
jgi:Gluconate 2-dehydrogenase subunit 3